ncbi:MAG: aminomethyl-transferring glycine dehydrogenase subunit GcvPA [Planctomycetales bacterium]|nr:aminomethyl-transferring glycine dehydrogenase subunit GcvPA [Planctomycetales bacterium]
MPYFYNTDDDRREMLEAIGAASVDELFQSIPADLRMDRPLEVGPVLTEVELTRHVGALAGQNAHAGNHVCFLGGGSYDHFVPAVVDMIASRSEFYTSYTPYQAEVSQGNLQVMFEYQSLITRLTGMDVSNASVYDGGSAAAEAVLMAISCSKRDGRVLAPESVHPEYRATVETYLENIGTRLETLPATAGRLDLEQLSAALADDVACVFIQHPNFFGALEEMEEIARLTHEAGALLVVSFDPISLGLLQRPGDYGADIAVAEGQSLGTPMQFGGPYLGIMTCKQEFVRRMPGRIAGETVDREGRRCFVLTLQTREQHIRREKATSNICTNQGLFALRATVYLSQMGPQGLREVSNGCLQKSRYAIERITSNPRFELAFAQPTFKEFVIRDTQNQVEQLLATSRETGILAGIPLGRWYPDLDDCLLVAVTEKRTREEIDAWVASLTGETSARKEQHTNCCHA